VVGKLVGKSALFGVVSSTRELIRVPEVGFRRTKGCSDRRHWTNMSYTVFKTVTR